MGDLIKAPNSELQNFLEGLDSLGVSPQDLKVFRTASSWKRLATAKLLQNNSFLWAVVANEKTAAKAGFNEDDFKKLGDNEDLMRQLHQVVRGYAEVKPIEHLVDLDADPFVPGGWKVEEHQKGGRFRWDAAKVELYFSEPQRRGRSIEGNKLRSTLKGQSVFNANLLDYLLKNPHLIPEAWKGKCIFFWGTIYRYSVGRLCVRCLFWLGDGWGWGSRWLGHAWGGRSPAALHAS